MIRVSTMHRGLDCVSFAIEGHADAAPYGQDLVCAAVSVIVQTSCLALEQIAGIQAEVKPGDVRWSGVPTRTANVIIETMLIGLKELARDHPDHVTFN